MVTANRPQQVTQPQHPIEAGHRATAWWLMAIGVRLARTVAAGFVMAWSFQDPPLRLTQSLFFACLLVLVGLRWAIKRSSFLAWAEVPGVYRIYTWNDPALLEIKTPHVADRIKAATYIVADTGLGVWFAQAEAVPVSTRATVLTIAGMTSLIVGVWRVARSAGLARNNPWLIRGQWGETPGLLGPPTVWCLLASQLGAPMLSWLPFCACLAVTAVTIQAILRLSRLLGTELYTVVRDAVISSPSVRSGP